jgi:hypothetical protein
MQRGSWRGPRPWGMLPSFPAPATSMLLFVVLLPQIVINCEMRNRRVKAR